MADDLVGTLMDAGLSPQDVRELLGPAYATDHDPGAPVDSEVRELLTVNPSAPPPDVVRQVLTAAQSDRQPPGPQVAVPSGVANSLPQSQDAKAIRVDTEHTYRKFRNGDNVDMRALDQPENSEQVPDVLNQLAQSEAGLTDGTPPPRGYASQWITGMSRRRKHMAGEMLTGLSPDQACLLCGVKGGHSPLCARCNRSVLGLFSRGAASEMYGSIPTAAYNKSIHTLGADPFYRLKYQTQERAIVGAEEFYRLQHQLSEAVVGSDEFYRLQHQVEEMLGGDAGEFYRLKYQTQERAIVGSDDPFYRLKYQTQERAIVGNDDPFYRMTYQTREAVVGAMYSLSRFMDEAYALSSPADGEAQSVPLAFEQPDAEQHIATWKQGDNLYASMRVVGWDGQPRVLTASTPYSHEVGCVMGYATAMRVPRSQLLGALDPLARTLGASKLVPRLAASAPAVLHAVHGQVAPLVMATMPVTNHRVGV